MRKTQYRHQITYHILDYGSEDVNTSSLDNMSASMGHMFRLFMTADVLNRRLLGDARISLNPRVNSNWLPIKMDAWRHILPQPCKGE